MSVPPVFDFHARLTADPGARDALLATMAENGIRRAAVSAGGLIGLEQLSRQIDQGGRCPVTAANDRIRELCAATEGRLLPFFFADPLVDTAAYRAAADGFHGLEISPAVHGFRFDHPAVAELVATAEAATHPVYAVSTARPGARAGDLARLAAKFPAATFVWGHCGHTGLDVAGLAELTGTPNVLAETSGCFTVTAREAVRRLGPRRVLFGTEYPLQHPSVELAKAAALGLDPADRQDLMWDNACRVLGVSA